MGVFRQLGDPVAAAAGLCQHHEAAYAEFLATATATALNVDRDTIANGATIVQVQITTTETCCVVVNAATYALGNVTPANLEIERPLGTIRTQQEDSIITGDAILIHHAAWEVLTAGTYTYYLVNRAGASVGIIAAWIKAVASDCLG